MPSHQSRCLRLGLPALSPGGFYIVEDIHTSHPSHAQFRSEFGSSPRLAPLLRGARATDAPGRQTSLSLLLAFEHLRRRGVGSIDPAELDALATGEHFSHEVIESLYAMTASVQVYKRATLPGQCWRCGSERFDYLRWRCACGTELLAEADTMTVLIRKRTPAA